MTADQLKNSILQMAVQGKLVPQDPNDEPASVLLRRIRAEKEQMIKEGKIKKEKNSSYIFRGPDGLFYEKIGNNEPVCVEDEVPFDIPESWEWVRLGEYVEKVTDQVASGSFASLRANVPSLKEPDYALMIKTADFSNNFTKNLTYTTKQGYDFLNNSNLFGGELILSNIGSIGKCFIVPKLDCKMTLAPNSVMIRLVDEELRDYLYYFILSPQGYLELIQITSGTAMKKFNKTDLKTILIPIPPFQEQLRIVKKINETLLIITRYGKLEGDRNQLNVQFPEDLKKSVLQQAVQGKLVPQNPNDEPASVLLGKIRAEKEQMIKEGKIKRDKHESVIYRREGAYYEKVNGKEQCIDDEIPFDIPDSWEWARLNQIAFKITDGTHNSPPNTEHGDYMYVTAKNIKEHGIDLSDITYVSKNIHNEIYARCNPRLGDVLLIKDGATTGIATVNDIEEPFSLLSSVALIKLPRELLPWYLVYVIRSDLFYKIIRAKMKGTGITRVTLKQIEPMLVPVPPYEEQNRIVDKINSILPYIDSL